MQSSVGYFRYETVHSTSWRACKPEKVLLNLVATKGSDYVEDFFFCSKALRPALWPIQSPAQWVIDGGGLAFPLGKAAVAWGYHSLPSPAETKYE